MYRFNSFSNIINHCLLLFIVIAVCWMFMFIYTHEMFKKTRVTGTACKHGNEGAEFKSFICYNCAQTTIINVKY